jgi:hypothetical protein
MADKKRKIGGYEELYSVRLGGGEVIMSENPDAEDRYGVFDCNWNNMIGLEEYSNGLGSADFLEIMKEFTHRLSERIAAVEAEREERGITLQPLTSAACQSIDGVELEGRVVAIRQESLSQEYRSIDNQLALCTGGFGASPDARGRTVYCKNLYSGKQTAWKRDDIAGTFSEEKLPNWARESLAALRQSAERESVMDKIRQDRTDKKPPGPKKTKSPNHKKDGQEH